MIRTTCPYCGVGCGLIAEPGGRVVADPDHPANFGRLCSKGAALAETLDDHDRLRCPTVGGAPASWDNALDLIATRFAGSIAAHGPDSVALYVSGQCLTEDYYVANKLMKGFIGSANIDTNSRLCMASSVAGHIRAFGGDVVPGIYEDLEEADLIVLIGSNLAWCHPVLHQRLLAARARRGTRIVVIDPRRTATCETSDLHLPLAAGSDVALFNALLIHMRDAGRFDLAWVAAHTNGLDATLESARQDAANVVAITGLDPADIDRFFAWFAATPRVVTVFSQGVNQSSSGTDKVNAIINCHLATGRIGRPGAGPFSITGQPNAMGGREVGGLANQLAAHMRFDDPAAIDRVRRFWRAPAMATRPGLKAVDLFDAALDGRVKALWIIATNPADSLPRSDRVRAALRACPFVVVSDCWPTDTTAFADVVLPAAGWAEKDGSVTNSERMISRQRAFRAAPGEARADWRVLADLGRRMGFAEAFAWPTSAAVFREHAALSAFENDGGRAFDIGGLAALSDADYDSLQPVRWPVPAGAQPFGRLFARGGFPTADGRARIVPVTHRPPANVTDAGYPILLNTGRVRDQWHTMTRTGLVPRLGIHTPEPTVALSAVDAQRHGIGAGDLVRVDSPQGATILRAVIDPAQRPGEAFASMHWTDAFSSAGPVGQVIGGATDPVSGQPELKATPIRIAPVPVVWRGLLLHRRAPNLAEPSLWWSRLRLAAAHAVELAGTGPLPRGPELGALMARLLSAPKDADRIEMADPARGVWRCAALRNDRLEACLFIAAGHIGLPSRDALIAVLDTPIEGAARIALLAGVSAPDTVADRAVCACFSVGLAALRDAIATRRLTTVAAIGAAVQAGTNCGSCIPELREILNDALAECLEPAD